MCSLLLKGYSSSSSNAVQSYTKPVSGPRWLTSTITTLCRMSRYVSLGLNGGGMDSGTQLWQCWLIHVTTSVRQKNQRVVMCHSNASSTECFWCLPICQARVCHPVQLLQQPPLAATAAAVSLLQSAGLLPLLMGIEMPLVKVLAAMESTGIAINRQVLADQVPAMLKRMEQLAQQAAVYNRGVRFDLVRNGQGTLSRLLFGTKEAGGLQLQPPVGTKRTR